MDNKRITILDGFRVIAIIVVLLFHFYTFFQDDKYLYNFGFTNLFSFGKLGVEFFFIISGFVISLTLTKCSNFVEFLKKRFLRLIPAMLVCSIITFAIMRTFDSNLLFAKSHSFSNLLLSNTFISPELINNIFQTKYNYIDGAYWSLWVEINFYIVIGIVYFCNKNKLLQNFSIVSLLLTLIYFLFTSKLGGDIISPIIGESLFVAGKNIIKLLNLVAYSNWFLLGIILYNLYHKKLLRYYIYFTIVFVLQIILIQNTVQNILFLVFIYSLLMLFIYKPNKIRFLGNTFISKLGVVSYSVYLIHGHIGVLVINKFSWILGNYNWIIGVVLIGLFFLFGIFSYKFLEKPISTILKKIMFR
ncbi:acyltransferase family protein [Kaistella antarctica]|uniref:O-acetyltransferase OatA n=1 Tax=Kaistella antarctica TaxID=266748 RepID=A0A448NRL0_9FLAO|nr:acyltransferase [Kaistella antarctica]KEY18779.1 hypothetical protein HY04_09910 [Kaistella antarctica]SEW15526.1 Peptidoglycan/LPS O-acetylase OafA/YrhL, contains acyltransferase and SGNH-hydrolase domains [Kaistella antarctica]VEH99527.1 O-acetyltransferase OatA [Kaistella antarctica]